MKFLGCTHRVKARRSSHIIAARRSLAAQQPQGVGLAHHRVLFNHLFLSVGGQAGTRGGYGGPRYSTLRRSCERSAQEDSADKVLKKMKVAVTSRPASQFPAVASAFEGGHSNSLDSCYEFATGISK